MTLSSSGSRLALTILQERSTGTFARVYLAEAQGQDGLSRIVAVKVLKEQWTESEELIRRTRDEAMLLARLRHKNILRVEAMTQIDGNPAIVMEFVDGVDLGQLIEPQNDELTSFPPRAAYQITMEAASALQAAWARTPYGQGPLRVVHRDIKPPNIMISIEGEVKVLDFGTARFTHDLRAAKTGVMRFGSMKYMSPERRNGARGEHTCDVYSLGLVLIEMLRGETLPLLPIDAQDHDEAVDAWIAELDNLGLPNDEWEESLRETLFRMCTADPAARLSAEDVIELMRAFRDNAHGESLDAFAHRRVRAVAQAKFGRPAQGDLSGSQVFIHVQGSAEGLVEAPPPEPQPPLPSVATSDTSPPPQPILDQPVTRSSSKEPKEDTTGRTTLPDFEVPIQLDKTTGSPPATNPLPSPITADMAEQPATVSRAKTSIGRKHPIVMLTMLMLPIFFISAVGMAVMATKACKKKGKRSERTSERADKSSDTKSNADDSWNKSQNKERGGLIQEESAKGSKSVRLNVQMDAGTETIRYIRFSDAETGQPIKRIKSSMSEPATELSLSKKVPSGDIMLQIKLHYGAERVAYFQIDEDLSLDCSIDSKSPDQIICTHSGGPPIYLQSENDQ